jgi:hypothetical protein
MSAATFTNTCTVCGAEESLDALLLRMIDDDTVRRLIAQVITDSIPLGGMVVRYLRLHKPAKQKLRMSIVGQLLAELVPDMTRGVIERTGRSWACDGDGWKAGLQAVFDAQDKGTLSLPLQGNGYLYQVLMNMADKTEAVAEKHTDAVRSGRSHTAGAQPVSVVLDQLQAAAPAAPLAIPAAPPAPAGPRVESQTVRAMKAELAARKGTQP